MPDYKEGVDSGLHVTGNINMSASAYVNWGPAVTGSSGFGLRSNDGTIQVKSSGGSWANMGSTSLSGAIELLAFDQVIISHPGVNAGNAIPGLKMSGSISCTAVTASTDLTASGEVMCKKVEADTSIEAGTTISGAGAVSAKSFAANTTVTAATTVSGAGEIAGQTLKIGNTTTVDAERSFTGLNITASQALSAASDVDGGAATFNSIVSKTSLSGAGNIAGQNLTIANSLAIDVQRSGRLLNLTCSQAISAASDIAGGIGEFVEVECATNISGAGTVQGGAASFLSVSGTGGLTGSALRINNATLYQADELGEYGPNTKGKIVTTDTNGNITFENVAGNYGGEGGVLKFGDEGDTTLSATGSYYGTGSFILSSSHAIRIIMSGALGENDGTSGSFTIQDGDENEYMVFNTKVGNESIFFGKQLIAGFETPGNAISPGQDNDGHAIGAADLRWSNIYAMNVHTGDLHLENHLGNWTVIEDSDFLTLRNNKNGKRFKILMEAMPELDEEV